MDLRIERTQAIMRHVEQASLPRARILPWQGHRGIGASVPYLAQSLSCGIQYTFYNIGYT